MDPYSILNVDKIATEARIQSSYKNLSKTFHPDRQPPGKARDAAQEVFVAFKNAHEILTDPVLRQVYDDYGNEAVRIVKMSIHSQDPDALYPTLLKYHQMNQKKRARSHVLESLEEASIEKLDHEFQVRTFMEFPCSTESTCFSKEGVEPIGLPELSGASLSVSSTTPASSKMDITLGISTEINKGKGNCSRNVAIGYKPQQGTQILANVDLSNFKSFSIGTTRTLASNTTLTATARSIPKTRTMALSLVSHRDLWKNKFRGTWALGVGSDFSLHYGLFSFTTLFTDYPTITAKFNIGVNQYPIKLSAKKLYNDGSQIFYCSLGWGSTGEEVKAIFSRAITSYTDLSMGIKHASHSGLTWLFQVERGGFTFRLPILISSVTSSTYYEKTTLLSCITMICDQAIGQIWKEIGGQVLQVEKDEFDYKSQKTKHDAEQQLYFMKPIANLNTEREHQRNGLVIYQACYFIEQGPRIDAKIQLQFWVRNGVLQLPSGSKSQLMGFYTLLKMAPNLVKPFWSKWASKDNVNSFVPQLWIRYASGDSTYEITIQDTDSLHLPNKSAAVLGARDIVR